MQQLPAFAPAFKNYLMRGNQNKTDPSDNSLNKEKNQSSAFSLTDHHIPHSAEREGKSFSIEVPAISLPKGGGAVKGIEENFKVNAANGTASFSIPIPVSPARGFAPSFSLNYNSGSGNGPFGLGWDTDIPGIARKTEKELPRYSDDDQMDDFIITGEEDLVPFLENGTDGWNPVSITRTESGIQYKITPYRPRMEGQFTRIEKWINILTREIHWRTTGKDNVTSFFGMDANSRISDPHDDKKVYKWLLSFSCDDKGNIIQYEYKKEDFAGVEKKIFERNKIDNCTNVYLAGMLYGNTTPFHLGDALLAEPDFMFRVLFDYGEYDTAGLGFYTNINSDIPADIHVAKNTWTCRQDPFSHFRAGFEIRNYRICRRIMLFHCFDELRNAATPCLVQSLEFLYNDQLQLVQQNDSIKTFSCLARITKKGHKWDETVQFYHSKAFPSYDFSYQQHEWNTDIHEVDQGSIMQAPVSTNGSFHQWIDLFGEGIPGIITEQGNGWYYKSNLGNGEFAPPELISPKPSFTGLGSGTLFIQELEANGKKYAVSYANGMEGFFSLAGDGKKEWEPFKNFEKLPNINFNDPSSRWIDLNGDGLPDLLVLEDDVLVFYAAKGENGLDAAEIIRKVNDEEKGPAILFSDGSQSIYLADMTGQGLTDIVRIKNGEVCYWANMGYGRFSAKVTMENAPVFDHPDAFNSKYIRLADIDGSGTTDIIYLGRNEFRMWSNHNGNTWLEQPEIINPFPEIHNAMDISVFDFLGTGTACIVWTSSLPADGRSPVRYIDLMGSRKPYLMQSFHNNTGKHVSLQYLSSTQFYLQDKEAGTPWITRLPFPVHILVKTETYDEITRARFVSEYSYHHGYYDQQEREFRGFARIDQKDTETYTNFIRNGGGNIIDAALHQPPVFTRTWFHTGASFNQKHFLSQFSQEYYKNDNFEEYHLPDAAIELPASMKLQDLEDGEYREVFRACKTMMLRQEIYAEDGTEAARHPYSVKEQNCHIRMLQPKAGNRHAVFTAATSESIIYNYERMPYDPRIVHNINLLRDKYNNVLKSVAIVYSRWVNNPGLPGELKDQLDALPQPVKDAQAALQIVLTENNYTNDIINDTVYRLRLASETLVYELSGANPMAKYFSLPEMKDKVEEAAFLAYNGTVNTALVQKRLIEHLRTLYTKPDMSGPLSLGQLAPTAVKWETYRLAYTAALVNDLFNGKVDETLLKLAQYRKSGEVKPLFPVTDAEDNWWLPSGTVGYPANPADHFFLPSQYIDPFGKITTAAFETKYHLFIPQIEDPAGNQTSVLQFNFRTLLPESLRDINDNITEVRFDILGKVAGTAIKGKGSEADDFNGFQEDLDETSLNNFFNDPVTHGKNLLLHATARVVYDYHHLPVSAATITRERHHQEIIVNGQPLEVQYNFEYSGGSGQVIMKKMQAEPGLAKMIDNNGVLSETDTSPNLRWIGNGKTILNNKGKPVKQYEPYFSVSHRFEDDSRLVEIGVTPLLFYDPLGRIIRTELPDTTFSKTLFDSWKQSIYDNNDTITTTPWYNRRFNRLMDAELIAAGKDPAKEKEAAEKTFRHKETPRLAHLDSLGRKVYDVAHNKDKTAADVFHETFFSLDIEGNIKAVTNALGKLTMTWRYDITGNQVRQQSMEGGERMLFADVTGNLLRQWNSRNFITEYSYDDMLRLVAIKVTGGDGSEVLNHIVRKIVYGEGLPGDKLKNIRGQTFQSFDQSGIKTVTAYDFKNNPVSITKQFCSDYKKIITWGAAPVALETEIFESSITYDALNRIVKTTLPHASGSPASGYSASYNQRSLLQKMTVSILGAPEKGFVNSVQYNEKGQRTEIVYGNNSRTTYKYDNETFRLLRIRTTRPAGLNGLTTGIFNDQSVVQDCRYTFDPVGNITGIADDAVTAPFFDGEQSNAAGSYEYDALYRLIGSTGRKHAGQTDIAHTRSDFQYRNHPLINSGSINPNNVNAFRNYTEEYTYDKAGNMTGQKHIAKNSSWTRSFDYALGNNQLTKTTVGAFTTNYDYDLHGNIKHMEHLQDMTWDYSDALHQVDLGGGGIAWYVCDAEGQRVRKVIERLDGSKKERLYVGDTEIFREKDNGGIIKLERISLKITDDKKHIALVDIPTIKPGGSNEIQLIRYQYSNHLGSSALELDDTAKTISYEEYFPFGATSYSLTDTSREVPAKRYRFTAKERDEESGLNYHGARYYTPWLCRWIAVDKLQREGMDNRYIYVKNNPLIYFDSNGLSEEPVHGALTYKLALAAGFSEKDAARIALATAGMDHDPATRPGDTKMEMANQIFLGRTQEHHYPDQGVALAKVESDIAKGKDINLTTFGKHLHSLEDVGFPDAPGPHNLSEERALPQAAGFVASVALAGGLGAMFGAIEAVKGSGPGWKFLASVLGILAGALFAAGALFLVFGILAANVGHPTVETEIHQSSTSFSHIVDEAYQNPRALKREYEKIFPILKRAAAAHGATLRPDEDKAKAEVKEAGEADTPEKIDAYLNKEGTDNKGNPVHSYAYWVARQGECGNQPVFEDITRWTRFQIDISVNDVTVRYRVQHAAVCH